LSGLFRQESVANQKDRLRHVFNNEMDEKTIIVSSFKDAVGKKRGGTGNEISV
jgi:hypothetical protein